MGRGEGHGQEDIKDLKDNKDNKDSRASRSLVSLESLGSFYPADRAATGAACSSTFSRKGSTVAATFTWPSAVG